MSAGLGAFLLFQAAKPVSMVRTPDPRLDRPHVTGRVQYPRLHVGGLPPFVWPRLQRTPDPRLDRLHVTGRPPFPRAHVGGLPPPTPTVPLSLGPDGSLLYGLWVNPRPPPPPPPVLRLAPIVIVAGPFPTQYGGFRAYYHGATQDLCLVAVADAPTGMGGVIEVRKGGTTYAAYLVETTDPNASPIRVQTSTGIRAIRVRT